jgi:hypothetical protein
MAKAVGDYIPPDGFVFLRSLMTIGTNRSLQPAPAWAEVWHIWTVIIPRRSITGRLVRGKVWRRSDGRRWIYKKFVEFDAA